VPEVNEGSVVDGRYRVLRRIGSGGMADVWLAEDTHLQRQVALKVLHRRFAQDREFVERFRREAEAAAGLQHPNIVAVYDRGEFEGTYYIAMQYVEGPTLKQLIDSGITIEQAVAVIRQVLQAAGYAHRQGIVHRDLKPQNVIVDPEGKAVVTDFGIARAGVSEITQTGSVMGTLMGTAFVVLLPELMEWISAGLKGSSIDRALALNNNITFLREITVGLIIIGFLMFEPDGLAHRWRQIRTYWKLYPFSH